MLYQIAISGEGAVIGCVIYDLMIYSKGKLVEEAGVERYYFLI